MTWDPSVNTGNVIAAAALLLTAGSLIFAGLQLRRNSLFNRARFIADLSARYFADDTVRTFFYQLDYNRFTFDPDTFLGTNEERWLDSLLYTFDVVGRLLRVGAVDVADVNLLGFQASRVLNNPEVVRYLAWLDGEHRHEGARVRAHDDARYLAEQISYRRKAV